MAGYRGQDLTYLKIGLSADPTDVLKETKGDLSITVDNAEIDTSSDSSGGDHEFILGNGTKTITGSFNYAKQADANGTAQHVIIDAAYSKALVYVEYALETTATTGKNYKGSGYVLSCGSTNGDPQTQSFTIKLSGAVTQGTQPA